MKRTNLMYRKTKSPLRNSLYSLAVIMFMLLIFPLGMRANETSIDEANQSRTVKGIVKDALGDPMIGVSIAEKGNNTNGSISNIDGEYSIQVPNNQTVLTFSFLGFIPQEVVVGNQAEINITLAEDTKLLDEVVVVSYGTQKKREVTGSITTIKAEALTDQPVGQFAQKLQGQVAGVQINQASGIPGQGMSFRIRGAASAGQSSQPLVVVDGLPVGDILNNINAEEIETFTVLKDAAATSLYGSRAANGVILITTKRGKTGRLSVSLSANYGIQSVSGMKEMDVMNAREFAQFKKEYYEDKARYEDKPGGTPTLVPERYQDPSQYGKGTDWYKELLRTAPIQTYSLSLTGGTDKMVNATTVGYFKQEGVVKNSSFERITLRSNSEYTANDKVKIGVNVAPMLQMFENTNTDGDRQILSAALLADPTESPYDKDGNLTVSMQSPGMFGQPNWIRYLNEKVDKYRILTLLANGYVDVDIWNGIKYKFQAGVELGNRRHRVWTPSTSAGGLFSPPPGKASASHDSETYYNWTIENMFSYDKSIGLHNFNVLAGYSAQKYSREWGNLNGNDFPDDDIPWIDAAATKNGGSGITEWTVASMIGRVNYNFNDRYLIQGNIRRDGSSRFGSGNKWANFPSVSAGWVASEEEFIKPISSPMSLNYLKLRGSYGIVGNYEIGNYTHVSNVVSDNYVFDNKIASGKRMSNIGNNKLTWEETSQLDIGLDLGFLNDRIFFMYDYYNKETKGMLFRVDIPYSSGFSDITSNMGKFNSWGHEFSLETRNLVGEFEWKTNLNLTFARNEVKELSTNNLPVGGYGEQSDWNRLQVGQPIGVLMGYIYDGVYMTQEEFERDPKHKTSQIGTARMKDISGPDGKPDGIIDINDRTIIGNPNPDMQFGITNEFAWKNFDLSILFTGQIGGDLFLGAYENTLNLDGVFNVLKDVKDRWRSPENPGNGLIPRTMSGTTDLYRYNHSGWIYDASYITLKNITLGYTVPISPNKYISKARVYVSGQQLFTISDYPGLNPEVSNNNTLSWSGLGVDRTTYPVPRMFTIGCNITF